MISIAIIQQLICIILITHTPGYSLRSTAMNQVKLAKISIKLADVHLECYEISRVYYQFLYVRFIKYRIVLQTLHIMPNYI